MHLLSAEREREEREGEGRVSEQASAQKLWAQFIFWRKVTVLRLWWERKSKKERKRKRKRDGGPGHQEYST